jgi:ferredoxin
MRADAGCMACGDCMAICPEEAIHMKSSYAFSKHFKTIDHSDLKLPRMK